jgi:hypothetical protein
VTKDTRNTYATHAGTGRHYAVFKRPPRNRLPRDIAFVVLAGICIGIGLGFAIGLATGHIIATVPW